MKRSAMTSPTATSVALANHEQVHRMTMQGIDNEDRVHLFRSAFEDELPAAELTDRAIISAMAEVELTHYSNL